MLESDSLGCFRSLNQDIENLFEVMCFLVEIHMKVMH